MHCFFFQEEDGIRVGTVTGVQTCALPIFSERRMEALADAGAAGPRWPGSYARRRRLACRAGPSEADRGAHDRLRSEERRVGKERGVWWCMDPSNTNRGNIDSFIWHCYCLL